MDVDVAGFMSYLEHRVGDGTAQRYSFLINGEAGPKRIRERALSPKYRRLIRASWRAYARFLAKSGKDADARALLEELDEVKLPPATRQRAQMPLPTPFFHLLRGAIEKTDLLYPAMRAQLGIMANRGLRRGDVLRATKRDVASALKTGTLSFTAKGSRRLEFGVLPTWRPYLELLDEEFDQHRAATCVQDLIADRQPAAEQAIARSLRRVAAELPLEKHGVELADVRPHVLRRSYATIFFEACGRDATKLKNHMQWADIATALSYVDVTSREDLDAIAEKMFG